MWINIMLKVVQNLLASLLKWSIYMMKYIVLDLIKMLTA
jgi:hypothetical protein